MANPILVTGATVRVGEVGRTVTELLLKQGKAVRAMVRNEDERAQTLRTCSSDEQKKLIKQTRAFCTLYVTKCIDS